MLTGIDHVLLACREPEAASQELGTRLGLTVSGGGRHEAHGTFNRLIWLGDSYLEFMGAFDRDLAARSWWGRHLLSVINDTTAGWMGVAFSSDDAAADADLLAGRGSTLNVLERDERRRPDGRLVRWRMLHTTTPDPDLGLAFLIEHDHANAEWTPEERAARVALSHPLGGPASLGRVEVPVADVRAARLRLLRDVGLAFRPSLAGRGARDASVGRQIVRLLPAGQSAVPAVVIRGGSRQIEEGLFGCRWLVEPTI